MGDGTRNDPIIVSPWQVWGLTLLDFLPATNVRQELRDRTVSAILNRVPEGRFFVFGWDQDTIYEHGVDQRIIATRGGTFEQGDHWIRHDMLGARKVVIKRLDERPLVGEYLKKKTLFQELKETWEELRHGWE